MKTYNMNIVKENMLMSAELIKVMKILEENNIEALAFKGPTLAQMAYGDITLRQYMDLDIFLDYKDIQKCYQLLIKNNYQTDIRQDYLKNELFKETNSDIQFYNKQNNILLEAHWKLFRNQFSDKSQNLNLFEKKQSINIQKQVVYTCSNEILLVYLCMHGSKHCWERIGWILDIDKIIRHYPKLNWELIQKLSIELECETMLHLGLELSNTLFNTPIILQYKHNKNLITKTINSFIYLPKDSTELNNNLNVFKYHYQLNDTLNQKLKFLIRTIFPINAQDILHINLPKNLYFLYFIIKPFRLFIKYLSKIFK